MGKNLPAHEIKLGKIRVTIWANKTEDQEVWFNAVVSRLYKTEDTWKETRSLGHDDLPIAMQAIEMAYKWMWVRRARKERAERNNSGRVLDNAGRQS